MKIHKDLEAALTDVKNGMSKKKSGQLRGVPTILSKEEVETLVKWIFENQRKRFFWRKEEKFFLTLNV